MSASVSGARAWKASLARRAPLAVDARRFIANPSWEFSVWEDYFAVRRHLVRLDSPKLPEGGGLALAALYRDNIFETKQALVQGYALGLEGVALQPLLPDSRASRSRRLARAFGARPAVDREQFPVQVPPYLQRAVTEAVDEALLSEGGFRRLREWRFRGFRAGEHILSTLIRRTFDGAPVLRDHSAALSGIAAEVLRNYLVAERILGILKPEMLLVGEANYAFNGPLVDTAVDQGLNVIHTVPTWREDRWMSKRLTPSSRRDGPISVDRSTFAGQVTKSLTADENSELDTTFADRYGARWAMAAMYQPSDKPLTRDDVLSTLALPQGRPTAVIFSHVLWDASLFYGEDLFNNYAAWLEATIRAAVANNRVNWILKVHPANAFRSRHGDVTGESAELGILHKVAPTPPAHFTVLSAEAKASTLDIYEIADIAVTVRGTPGLEFACLGKPVLTAGSGHYSGLGFTIDSATSQEYLDRLASLPNGLALPESARERARRYAHTLFVRRTWEPTPFRPTLDIPGKGWHPLDSNIVLDRDTVAPGEVDLFHLRRWASWAVNGNSPDHLDF